MDYDPSAGRNTVHYWVCDGGTQAHDDVVGAEVRDFSIPLASRNVFLNQGVVVYFFANRTDYTNFIHAKYNDDATFAPGTAQCGKTSWQRSSGIITTVVWGTCAYSSTGLGDHDLQKTISHEAGHAFDAALSKRDGSGDPKSHKSGFVNVGGGTNPSGAPVVDPFNLTPTNWATLSDMSRSVYVCSMFSTLTSSSLEIALSSPSDAVCGAGSTVLPAYRVGGVGTGAVMKPQDIVMTRAPYFVNPVVRYEDLFAENFSNIADPNSPSTLLKMTDFILTRSPISGQPRAYNCSRTVVETYVQTQQPPTSTVMTNAGCPTGSY